jgi:hypothetical protein
MKKLAIIAILVALSGVASAQTGPATQLEATLLTTDPVPLQSGEDGDVTFRITNEGDTAARDVNVTIPDTYPFELKPDRQRSYEIGSITPGESFYISTELLVADDAPDGSNDLEVELRNSRISKTIDVPLEVQSRDIELNLANLKTSPTSLRPDSEDNTLTVEVVNNGEKSAENVVLDLELPEEFEQTSSFSTRQALGNVAPGQVKPAEFVFDISEVASSGSITVPAELTYSADDSTSQVTLERDFEVFLEGRPQFEVTNFSSNLQAGSTGTVSLSLRNTGDVESSSTRVRVLESGDQPFGYASASNFVGTIEPDQEATATFEVSVDSDAEAQDYLVDFEFRGVKDTEVFVDDTTQRVQIENGESSSPLESPLLRLLAGVVVLALVLALIFRKRVLARIRQVRNR